MNLSEPTIPFPLSFTDTLSCAFSPVILSVGTPRFLHQLNGFVTELADCDALHLQRVYDDAREPHGLRVDWIGSCSKAAASDLQSVMGLYFRRFAVFDELERPVSACDTQLIQRSADTVSDAECRRLVFDVASIHDECLLTREIGGARYSISLCRSTRLPRFSMTELSRVKAVAEMLLSVVYLHAQQVIDRRAGAEPGDGDGWFSALAARRGVALSSRETEICSALVSGRTNPEIAALLNLRESTVKTYTQRAFAKLNVTSRRELLAWMHVGG